MAEIRSTPPPLNTLNSGERRQQQQPSTCQNLRNSHSPFSKPMHSDTIACASPNDDDDGDHSSNHFRDSVAQVRALLAELSRNTKLTLAPAKDTSMPLKRRRRLQHIHIKGLPISLPSPEPSPESSPDCKAHHYNSGDDQDIDDDHLPLQQLIDRERSGAPHTRPPTPGEGGMLGDNGSSDITTPHDLVASHCLQLSQCSCQHLLMLHRLLQQQQQQSSGVNLHTLPELVTHSLDLCQAIPQHQPFPPSTSPFTPAAYPPQRLPLYNSAYKDTATYQSLMPPRLITPQANHNSGYHHHYHQQQQQHTLLQMIGIPQYHPTSRFQTFTNQPNFHQQQHTQSPAAPAACLAGPLPPPQLQYYQAHSLLHYHQRQQLQPPSSMATPPYPRDPALSQAYYHQQPVRPHINGSLQHVPLSPYDRYYHYYHHPYAPRELRLLAPLINSKSGIPTTSLAASTDGLAMPSRPTTPPYPPQPNGILKNTYFATPLSHSPAQPPPGIPSNTAGNGTGTQSRRGGPYATKKTVRFQELADTHIYVNSFDDSSVTSSTLVNLP